MSNLKKYKQHKTHKKLAENNTLSTQEQLPHTKKQKNNEKSNENFQDLIFFDKMKKFLPWIIIILTIILFANSINNDFLNWDDDRYITGNQHITLSWENIKYFFTNFYFVMYVPFTMLSYMIDYAIAGLSHPWVYHLHNLILHTANSILVYFFILQLFSKNQQKYFIAFASALLFAIHPLHVESVAWIAERKDVLYTLYFLLSLIAYLFYIKNKNKKFYFASLTLFIFSLLAKTQAVVLPLTLLLIDYIQRNFLSDKQKLLDFIKFKDKTQINIFLEKIPFFILSIIFAYIAIKASGTNEPFAERITNDTKIAVETGYGLIESLVLVSYSLFLYIAELFIPFKQTVIHPYPFDAGEMPYIYYLYTLFSASFFISIFWAWFKKTKILFFSLTFFIANIFIVLRIKNFIISEHYEYIPSIGIFILFAFFTKDIILKHNKLKKLIYSFTLIYIIFLSWHTFNRNSVFKNSLTFWNDITKKNNNVVVGYYNRANYLQRLGDETINNDKQKAIDYYNQAITDYTKAIELNPSNIGAFSNRGITKAKLENYYEAIDDFNKVIEIDSTYGNVYSNRGNAFAFTGQWKKAIDDYDKAIKLKPNFVDAIFNRGMAFANLNKNQEAIKDFSKVIELAPERNEVYKQRGIAYYYTNQFANAINDLNFYLKLYPTDYTALYYRGLSFEKNNQQDKANNDFETLKKYPQIIDNILKTITRLEIIGDQTGQISYYQQAIDLTNDILKIDNNNSKAYSRMGVIYGKLGDIRKAFNLLNKAIILDSSNYQAFADRGYAYFITDNYNKALADYNKAIELNPNDFVTYYNRALLYEKINETELAINDYSLSIKAKPQYAAAYFRRGLLFFKTGQKQNACNDWQTATNLNFQQAKQYLLKYCQND
jgi:tetratricopeptide (TPR) repeat protein